MAKTAALCILLVLIVAYLGESFAAEEKLNIGIKKRVKDCKAKSQKGDTLHMHYTVRLISQQSLCMLNGTAI